MTYCVNCGSNIDDGKNICRNCYSDPYVPRQKWERILNELKSKDVDFDDFSYKNEKLSLVIAIIISSAIILFFSAATIGIILLIIGYALLSFRIQWIHTKAGMMEINSRHYGDIYTMAQVAAGRLRIPMPPIYIEQDPIPNAYTFGFFNENLIVLNTGIIELLTKDELLSVIGHEMGHIKYRHVTWLILSQPSREIYVPWLSVLLQPIFNNWHLKSEYTADRAGLIASGEIDACLMTEVKLMSGKKLPENFNLDEYMEELENEKESLQENFLEMLFRTHPFPPNRMRQMQEFYKSTKFQEIWDEYSVPDRR